MQGRVRARHKMLNKRLKTWGILSQVFCHHITMHGDVFRVCAVAVVTQLTIGKRIITMVRLFWGDSPPPK